MQNAFGQQLRNALLPLLTGIHLVEDRVAETMAEIGIHYRRSSLVVGKTARGLHAGDRAPDSDLVDGMRNETIRLFDLLGTPVHQLLFFAGTTIEKANDLRAISHSLASEYDEKINVFVVIHGTQSAIAGVLFDPDGAAHALYEVEPAGIVLIRPDGYIGFRGGDNHVDALREYLTKLFFASQAL